MPQTADIDDLFARSLLAEASEWAECHRARCAANALQLQHSRYIGIAIGLTMAEHHLTAAQAEAVLQSIAHERKESMHDVARFILDAPEQATA